VAACNPSINISALPFGRHEQLLFLVRSYSVVVNEHFSRAGIRSRRTPSSFNGVVRVAHDNFLFTARTFCRFTYTAMEKSALPRDCVDVCAVYMKPRFLPDQPPLAIVSMDIDDSDFGGECE